MKKVFKVAHIRDLEKQVIQEQISYSRMVEIMNEMAHEAYAIGSMGIFERRNGIGYLTFTLEGMKVPTTLPVITKGNRDKANAWTWNGSLEKPTVRPSVRTSYHNGKEMTEIHYWLNDGICQCLGDCKDGNAGKDIPLKECEG